MPTRRMTEEGVRRLKAPAGKQVDYFDKVQRGLMLRVSWGGRKTWRAKYYANNKTLTHKLGEYPDLNVKQAREAAETFRTNLNAFLAAKANPPKPIRSFKDVAEEYVKREVDGKLRSAANIKAILKNAVYPTLVDPTLTAGDRGYGETWEASEFTAIRRGAVSRLLDTIEEQRGPRAADVALAVIRKIMNWHATRNDDFTSPIVKGMARSKPAERRGKRILNPDEITTFWIAASKCGVFGAYVQTLLLTAQRRNKVAEMRWDDVSDDGIWTIATEEREKGNAEKLQLPPVIVELLGKQYRVKGNPYVFPAAGKNGKGRGFYCTFSKGKTELDKLMAETLPDIPRWRLHDLRRTARSLMSEADVRPDIAERVLGHAIVGVEAVYDHHKYFAQKAAALVALATLVARIVDPPTANVIAIKRRR
jgi:integrase